MNYTYTAVDGTFTLNNVPENAVYTVVIQAGHWRRQFTETVGTSSLTGLSLSMPSTHAQGDIPLIAINTGSADAVECVFRDMGVNSNEVTDDTVTSGATLGGRIHLYKGIHKPGAVATSSTPSESTLMGGTSATALNSYDMVMFPCQGQSASESTSNIDQLIAYTSAGGRVFLTHYSSSWLNNNDTYLGNSLSGAANWLSSPVSTLNPDPGVGTVNTSFTRGATLSQWLYNGGYANGNNAGASDTGTQGQVQISTLRWDVSNVNDPAQTWLTLNADVTTSTNPVMQFSFNTPFGAAADAQFGRVLFNDYHVENVSESNSPTYPAECPTLASSSIAQEKMLEYALFDLSSFVIPVVSPTVSIGITTTPLSAIFQEGDTTDAINVNVTNTSSTLALDNTIALTVSLPAGLTPTAITDATGGWNCTLSTLTCTRTTSLAPQASDGIVITVSVPGNATGSASSITAPVTATVSSPTFSSNVTSPVTIITVQRHAAVTWATPAAITAGTPLSSTQLDAVGNTDGTYVYMPAAGTVLSPGVTTLSVTFTPTDQASYPGTATTTVTQVVNGKTPATVTLTNLALTYTGSPLPVTVTTSPAGLTVGLTYTGTGGTTYGPSSTAPTAPGSYTVVGTINDPDYTGTGSATLVISKATATVTLTNLAQTYTGSPLPVTVTTSPASLTVGLTYTGTGGTTYGPSSTAPTAPGSYTVVGTINDPDYTGTGSATLVISKATATVTLTNLAQTYTGSPLPVTVTTSPTGLTVGLTYTGTGATAYGPSSTAPSDAGTYAVSGTINDPDYTGTGSATLVVSPVPTTITVQSSANPSLSQSSVTFTAAVSTSAGTPTGSVNFVDGVNVLGTGAVSGGIATFATSSLSVGTHTITAVYLGSTDALAAASGPISQHIVDLTLSPVSSNGTTPSQIVLPGGTASYMLNITPTSGTALPAPLVLTVTGMPEGAVASIATEPWTQVSATSWSYPANTAFGDFPLTITVPQSVARIDHSSPGQPNSPSALWAALLLPFALVVRRKSKRLGQGMSLLLLLAAGVCATAGLTGCGTTSGLFAEQQQSYTITVTATAGTLTHSTQVTLTVE